MYDGIEKCRVATYLERRKYHESIKAGKVIYINDLFMNADSLEIF